MTKSIIPLKAEQFVAPRDEPLKYPGNRPDRGFILHDSMVYPVVFDEKDKGTSGSTLAGRVITDREGHEQYAETMDSFLLKQGVAPMGDRFPVLGYGSNPVPGQLVSKFGEDTIVPVLFGGMKGCDVVYNLISNQGYVFAEMALGQEGVKGEEVKGNVGVTFLDEKQLKEMVDSEQNYKLAFAPGDIDLESGEKLKGDKSYIFAGFRKIWVPEDYSTAVAIAELPSDGRKAIALSQEQTLDLVIDQFGLQFKSASEFAQHIRGQANMPEEPGKLKYDLQKIVQDDLHSLKPLAEQLTIVPDPAKPLYVFSDNNSI